MAIYTASDLFPDESTGFGVYGNSGGPLALLAGAWRQLVNDGLGADTNESALPEGSAKLWDAAGNYLYLHDVPYNTLIMLQISLTVTTTVANETVQVQLHAYNAGASVITFLLDEVDIPVVGTHDIIVTRKGFINGIIRDNTPGAVVDYDVEIQATTSAPSSLTMTSIFITKDD